MKTRSLLVASGLLVLMLGALSFLQKKVPGTERREKESRRLSEISLREATQVELTGPKGSFVFAKKGEGDWRIEKPLATQADSTVVGKLLSDVQFMERLQTLPRGRVNEGMIQTFGLGQPTRTLLVRTKEGVWKIEVGRDTPVLGGIYCRIRSGREAEEIVVAEKHLGEVLDQDLAAWREKRVMPLTVPDVRELLVHQGTLEVEVKKRDGEWSLLKPVEAPADPAAVTGILGEISTLQAVSFVSDTGGDLALYGLNAPSLAVEVKTASTNRVLQVGLSDPKETNQVFARVADQASVFLLPKASVDALGKMADRIRDKRVVTYPSPEGVQSMEISGRGGEFRLMREGASGRWMISTGGTNRVADTEAINGWLQALYRARVNRFLTTEDPAKLGLTKPRLSLTFGWQAKTGQGVTNRAETLKIGDEWKDEAFAQVSSTSGGMAVPAGILREIPEAPWGFLPRNLWPEGLGELKGLVWISGGKRKEFRREGGEGWRMQGSGKDCPEVAKYLDRWAALRVSKWAAMPAKSEFLKPEVELILEGVGGSKEKWIVGRPGSDGTAWVKMEGADHAGCLGKEGVRQLKSAPELPSEGEGPTASQR